MHFETLLHLYIQFIFKTANFRTLIWTLHVHAPMHAQYLACNAA